MKHITALFFAFILCLGLSAEEKPWPQEFNALNFDKPANELIMIYFSGSDWCKPCIKMKAELLDSDKFTAYAEKFQRYQADFPYRIKLEKSHKKFNEFLAESYNKDGQFPLLVIVNGEGKLLYKTGYSDISVEALIEKIEKGISK